MIKFEGFLRHYFAAAISFNYLASSLIIFQSAARRVYQRAVVIKFLFWLFKNRRTFIFIWWLASQFLGIGFAAFYAPWIFFLGVKRLTHIIFPIILFRTLKTIIFCPVLRWNEENHQIYDQKRKKHFFFIFLIKNININYYIFW